MPYTATPSSERQADLTPAAKTVVSVTGLRKVFSKRRKGGGPFGFLRRGPAEEFVAVDDVSFDIHEGEIFGLPGPNGAGKTTTIRMRLALLEPSSGSATVGGFDVQRQPGAVRQLLGARANGASTGNSRGRRTWSISPRSITCRRRLRKSR